MVQFLIQCGRMRPLFAAPIAGVVAVASAMAQYSGFATNSDGTQIILATTYRQPGAGQTTDPKVFRMEKGRAALALTQTCDALRLRGACGVGDLQASGTGAVVYQSRIPCNGGSSCIFRETSLSTLLLRGGELRNFAGRIRISRDGRYLVNHDLSGAPGDYSRVSKLINLETDSSIDLGADLRRYGSAVRVSDEGAVLMDQGWLVRPSGRAQLPNPEGSVAVDMDAQGTIVLAEKSRASLFAIDVRAGRYWQIGPADRASYGGTMSADGKWVLYISVLGETPQLFFSTIDGQIWRQLTANDDGVQRAILSGDGRSALALMRSGALLRIDTSTGAMDEVVGPLPYEVTSRDPAVPGSLNVLKGLGLTGQQGIATGRWPEELGGVRLTIADVAMRLYSVSPTEIVFQVPLELAVAQEPLVIHSPREQVFEPAIAINVFEAAPRRLAVVHEDFGSAVSEDNPAWPGEIVHIYATGLGRVEPAPESGEAARAEPLSRLASGWKFIWMGFSVESAAAEVPFVGLAPGFVGVYQVDLRIPERQRYDLYFMDPSGHLGFAFVWLPVAK